MNHPSMLQLSMLADQALLKKESELVNEHVSQCSGCQAQLRLLQHESQHLASILAQSEFVAIPNFATPLSVSDLFKSGLMLAGVSWVLISFWQLFLGELVLEVASWFTTFHLSESISVAVDAVFYVSEEGLDMINSLYSLALYSVGLAVAAWYAMTKIQLRGALGACLCVIFISSMHTSPVHALEIRRVDPPQQATVDADEVIEDSLILFGDTVLVEGIVEGDLIVFGRRAVIEGEVHGNLFSFTQSVDVEGEVRGSLYSFTQQIDLDEASVLSNLWVFAESLDMDDESSVLGDAVLFLSSGTIEGRVGRDLTSFSDRVEVNGDIGDDVVAYARSLALLDDATVAGDVEFHTRDETMLRRSEGAQVGGEVDIHTRVATGPRPNKFSTVHFYFSQLMRLAGAFITGLAFLALFPTFRQSSIGGGVEGLKSAGVGFLGLISLPLIAVLAAITFVGLPISVFALFAWVVLFYFSKIMLAWVLGNMLLASHQGNKFALPLITGLAVVIVVVNLPVVGGVLAFCMVLIGAGLLVQKVMEYVDGLNKAKMA